MQKDLGNDLLPEKEIIQKHWGVESLIQRDDADVTFQIAGNV